MDCSTRLAIYGAEAAACTRCLDLNLLHAEPRAAFPIMQRAPTGASGILIVGEAPNGDDTYDVGKGYLTYDCDTDPTGRFMHELLTNVVGVRIEDVLFTNAVLCLPARRRERHPVTTRQLDACRPWLLRLIKDSQASVVVTMGGKGLRALDRIERHGLTLKTGVGRLHPWLDRKLLPLYHPGLLGQMTRSADQQREDIRVLVDHVVTLREIGLRPSRTRRR